MRIVSKNYLETSSVKCILFLQKYIQSSWRPIVFSEKKRKLEKNLKQIIFTRTNWKIEGQKEVSFQALCWTVFIFTNLLITFCNYAYAKYVFFTTFRMIDFFHIFIPLRSIHNTLNLTFWLEFKLLHFLLQILFSRFD